MNNTNEGALSRLIELSKVDAQLAGIKADRKKREDALADKLLLAKKKEEELQDKKAVLREEQTTYTREEKRLKEENEKLVERRKALNSFSDYKVQQSAQKEIEQSAKQLATQEEKLIAGLDHTGDLQAEVEALQEGYDAIKKELDELEDDTKGALEGLQERETEKEKLRSELSTGIAEKDMTLYDRIRVRHVADPVVPIRGNVCTGCHIQVAAQMLVQVARGEGLVKCRGCGRILYLEQDSDLQSTAS